MDSNPTPFPVKKFQSVKSKNNRKTADSTSKINAKDPPQQRQKRVFGTARNPNLPIKPASEKPIAKPSSGVPQIQSKSIKATQLSEGVKETEPKTEVTRESPVENKAKPKKKSVCFQEKVGEDVVRNSNDGKFPEPKTPVKSPSLAKPHVSGTPYHSAQRCSKCRFDKLETSAYWLGQIKQAESVGKHFVAAAFFQLAHECKAEPTRNLRIELKKYLARHGYLSAETEWIKASCSYGLLKKDEINATEVESGSVKADTTEGIRQTHDQELKEEAA